MNLNKLVRMPADKVRDWFSEHQMLLPSDQAAMSAWLGEHGVDVSLWGQDKALDLTAFVEQVRGDDDIYVALVPTEAGLRVVRYVRGIRADVMHMPEDDPGALFKLRELRQVFHGPRRGERARNFRYSMGEKSLIDEAFPETLVRGLREELEIVLGEGDEVLDLGPGPTHPKMSSSFPGVVTVHMYMYYMVTISACHYRSEYQERHTNKTTHFGWEQVGWGHGIDLSKV